MRSALRAAQAPLRLLVALACWKTCVTVVPETMLTRRKSALDEFEPCARYHEKVSDGAPAGRAIAGEVTLVTPPHEVVRAARRRAQLLGAARAGVRGVGALEAAGAGRVGAVASTVRPRAASKSSAKTAAGGAMPQYAACLPMTS